QNFVRLLGVGFLSIGSHKNLAVKNALGMIVQNSLVELVTVAMWFGMIDDGVVIDMLPALNQIKAIDPGLATPPGKGHQDFVAHQGAALGKIMRREPT